MSLLANIDHLAIAAGIEAVVVDAGTREYRGDESWQPVLDGALELFNRADEKSIRLVIGSHTIVVQREGTESVGVVLPTGHAIAKSLRRMIRRMARKNRGPLVQPEAEPAKPEATRLEPTSPATTGSPTVTTPASPGQSTPPSGGQLSVPPATKAGEDPKPTASSGPTNASSSTDRGNFPGGF